MKLSFDHNSANNNDYIKKLEDKFKEAQVLAKKKIQTRKK